MDEAVAFFCGYFLTVDVETHGLVVEGGGDVGPVDAEAGHDVGNQLAMRSLAKRETPAGSSAEMSVAETPSKPRRLGWNRP